MIASSESKGWFNAVLDTNIHVYYIWRIEDFTNLPDEVGESVESISFSASRNVLDKWSAECFPGGDKKINKGYVSVFIYSDFQITASGSISIVNSSKVRVNVKEFSHCYQTGKGFGFFKFVDRESLISQRNTLLPDNKLTLYIEMTVLRKPRPAKDISFSKLTEDFRNLLSDPQFSDITILVGGEELPAHRNILSARSQVFSKMLVSQMAETATKQIAIEDASKEAVKEMLHYIYTGKSHKITELSHELYYLAHKYFLDELKIMCEESLQKSLTLRNCVEVLLLADRFVSKELKTFVLDFIIDNIDKVMEDKSFKDLTKSNGGLISEILAYYVKTYRK